MSKRQNNNFFLNLSLLAGLFFPIAASAIQFQALSTRGEAGPGVDNMVVGITVVGEGSKQYIFTAVGPTTGIPEAIKDPQITLFNSAGVQMDFCDDWKNCTGANIVAEYLEATNQTLDDKEAALSLPLTAGSYTAHIQGASGIPGIALGAAIEVGSEDGGEGVDPQAGNWKGEDGVAGTLCFFVEKLISSSKLTESVFSDCQDDAAVEVALDGKLPSGESCKVTFVYKNDIPIENGQFNWEGNAGGADINSISGVFIENGFAKGTATEREAGTDKSTACSADWTARN